MSFTLNCRAIWKHLSNSNNLVKTWNKDYLHFPLCCLRENLCLQEQHRSMKTIVYKREKRYFNLLGTFIHVWAVSLNVGGISWFIRTEQQQKKMFQMRQKSHRGLAGASLPGSNQWLMDLRSCRRNALIYMWADLCCVSVSVHRRPQGHLEHFVSILSE